MKTSNTKSRPTHRIYAVTKNGDSKFWQPIGAMRARADGKGFSQRLDYTSGSDELSRSMSGSLFSSGPAPRNP